jgi:hypothetical protein
MYINRVDNTGRPAQPESARRNKRKQDDSSFNDLLETAIVDSVELADPDGKRRDAGFSGTKRKEKEESEDVGTPEAAPGFEQGKGLNVTV